MAKLTNTIIEGTLQVEQDALVTGDLTCMEYINTKGIRYSYLD